MLEMIKTDNKSTNKLLNFGKRIYYNSRLVYQLSLKFVRESFRTKVFIIFALLFPAAFMCIYSFAFGSSFSTPGTMNIYVVNDDLAPIGHPMYENVIGNYSNHVLEGNYSNLGETLVKFLSNATFSKGETAGDAMFHITLIDEYNETIEDRLSRLDQYGMILVLSIPDNFSTSILNLTSSVQINVKGDPSLSSFLYATSLVNGLFDTYFSIVRQFIGDTSGKSETFVEATIDVEDWTWFDFSVPGLIIFAMLMTVAAVATQITEEVEFRTIERLQLTAMRPGHFIGGLLGSQLFIGLFQVTAMFGFALLVGFKGEGSFIQAGLICWLSILPITAIGFMVGGLVKKSQMASAVATLIAVPLSFLTGAFFPLDNPTIIENFFGHKFGLFDFLPMRHSVTMMQRILIYQEPLSSLTYELTMFLCLSAIYLVMGLVIVTLFKLRSRKE
jgi:ABC-2 type transport system permease protein